MKSPVLSTCSGVFRHLCAAVLVLLVLPTALAAQPVALKENIVVKKLMGTENYAVLLARDPHTGGLYYANTEGAIYRVDFAGSAPASVPMYTAADHGMSALAGFTFSNDGTMFLLGNFQQGKSTVLRIRRGVPTSGGDTRVWSMVAESEPYPLAEIFNHLFNSIIVSPDQQYLFVQGGARGNHGEVHDNGGAFPGARELPLTSVILRLPIDADSVRLLNSEQALRTAGYWYADGVRNTYSMAFAPNGDLFGVENSGDRDDSEELNWIRENHHYGFPWRMGTNDNPQQFSGYDPSTDKLINPRFTAAKNGYFYNDPTYPPPPEGVVFTNPIMSVGPDADKFRDPVDGVVKDASDMGITIGTFTAHRSPLGLVFDTEGVLNSEYRGDGFCLSWTRGSAINDTIDGPFFDASEDLLHLRLVKIEGDYRVEVRRIVEKFSHPVAAVLSGATMYVLESDGDHNLYEITLPVVNSVGQPLEAASRIIATPNPAGQTATVSFELEVPAIVSLKLFDAYGRESVLIADQFLGAGAHAADLNAAKLASGRYYYRLVAGGNVYFGTLAVVH